MEKFASLSLQAIYTAAMWETFFWSPSGESSFHCYIFVWNHSERTHFLLLSRAVHASLTIISLERSMSLILKKNYFSSTNFALLLHTILMTLSLQSLTKIFCILSVQYFRMNASFSLLFSVSRSVVAFHTEHRKCTYFLSTCQTLFCDSYQWLRR